MHSMQAYQIDFERVFAYVPVSEITYARPHAEIRALPGTVCQLLRSLYGLKQAPQNWNAHLHEFLVSMCFERSA